MVDDENNSRHLLIKQRRYPNIYLIRFPYLCLLASQAIDHSFLRFTLSSPHRLHPLCFTMSDFDDHQAYPAEGSDPLADDQDNDAAHEEDEAPGSSSRRKNYGGDEDDEEQDEEEEEDDEEDEDDEDDSGRKRKRAKVARFLVSINIHH